MSDSKLRDWLEIVGIGAVVASLVFVGIEVRNSSRSALEESLNGGLANTLAIEELVVENADVWLRGCLGEQLDDIEQMQFTHIANAYQFSFFMQWMRNRSGVASANDKLTIDNWAWNLYRSEGLRRVWERHAEWRWHVTDEFPYQQWRALVDARVAEYPDFEPEPIDNVFRCGLN